jgi:hypothetical protein
MWMVAVGGHIVPKLFAPVGYQSGRKGRELTLAATRTPTDPTAIPHRCMSGWAGVQWMYGNFKQGRGCVLGDEPGLGKTVQVGSTCPGRQQNRVRKGCLGLKRILFNHRLRVLFTRSQCPSF